MPRRPGGTETTGLYLGIDLGTSGVKAVLVDGEDRIEGQSTAPLEVSTPRPLWSEQDPEDWWTATCRAVDEIKAGHGPALAATRAIGLSGQMHGATLLDARGEVLRPAILWNDGRSGAECAALEARVPESRRITGNLAMPGFTAPKLLWVAAHEPEVFGRVAKVLLPKDYLRYRLSGEHVAEMSDASGTLWLDVANRRWSEEMLAATGLGVGHMPRLVEGSAPSASLSPALARRWGMSEEVVIAGGAGDNAAGAAGIGTVAPGRAFLSLGTSGVLFAANRAYAPNPERAVHAFCHCFPDTWHQMSVILSAAASLAWAAAVTGAGDEAALVAEAEPAEAGLERAPLFLPYLTGERTPHNDPTRRASSSASTRRRAGATSGGRCSRASPSPSRTGMTRSSRRGRRSTRPRSSAAARGARSGAASSPPRSAARSRTTRGARSGPPSAPPGSRVSRRPVSDRTRCAPPARLAGGRAGGGARRPPRPPPRALARPRPRPRAEMRSSPNA